MTRPRPTRTLDRLRGRDDSRRLLLKSAFPDCFEKTIMFQYWKSMQKRNERRICWQQGISVSGEGRHPVVVICVLMFARAAAIPSWAVTFDTS
jgi:hypothetical protein